VNNQAPNTAMKIGLRADGGSVPSSDEITDEAEPPGETDEPPQICSGRKIFFPGVSDELWNSWKWQFQNRITSVKELSKYVSLSAKDILCLEHVTQRYPLSITPYSSVREIDGFLQGYDDPLDEKGDSVVAGLVHRYSDRALMVTTNICPMLCRHCTRKRDWNQKGMVHSKEEFEAMFDYIRSHPEIRDVIVSGGDPLSLSTQRLEGILSELRSIKHIEIIRIGSRFPVVMPQRIDDELCEMLSRYSPVWFNTHFNTVREITPESAAACDRLLRHGIPVNNQSVLLKGVNDSVESQLALCQGLLKIKVRPYYLFQCDEVKGAARAHFWPGYSCICG